MDSLVDVDELASFLGVKKSTIYGWVHERYVPHYKLGRLVRFNLKEVELWVKERHREGRKHRILQVDIHAAPEEKQKELEN